MEKLLVHGGSRLSGSVTISGSKNSSLPILAATLLTEEPCTIRRVPDLSDTNYMVQILKDEDTGFFGGLLIGAANGLVGALTPLVSGLQPFRDLTEDDACLVGGHRALRDAVFERLLSEESRSRSLRSCMGWASSPP